MSLHSFKGMPNVIQHINSYLHPMYITDDIRLSCKKDQIYNYKLYYLIKYNIPIKYAMIYAEYPKETMNYLIILSRIIGTSDAFDILMNIIGKKYKLYHIDNSIIKANHYNVIKILKYNFSWTIILHDNKIHVELIKILLNETIDFYFLELLNMNTIIKDEFIAYKNVLNSIEQTIEYKNIYYKLTAVRIPQNLAYNLCKMSNLDIDKIIEIARMGFNDVHHLIEANNFNKNQMDFLRFSKLAYVEFEEFNKFKQTIFNNAIKNSLIIIDDDYIYDLHCGLFFEPNSKKQKTV